MKRILLLFAVLNLTTVSLFGQTSIDTIAIKKEKNMYQFYMGQQKLTPSELANAIRSNEEAYKEFKAAKSDGSLASVCGFAGGFIIGWPIGTALAGGKANWAMAGIGAGFVAISIPIKASSTKHAKKAIDIYNKDKLKQPIKENKEIKISMNGNGFGLLFRF